MIMAKPDPRRLADLGDTIKAAGLEVLKGMKATRAGDSYRYNGSMSAVEWLRDAIAAFERYQIMGDDEA